MPKKITDDELLARIDQEMRQARDYMGGKLASQRRKAMQYYLAEPTGDLSPPEVQGRSSIISTDVADTIEWMLPSLLRIFTASDSVVRLAPRKRGMEQTAEDATEYLNWIFNTQNDGFRCLYTMFKDALLSKTGVLKVWWDDREDQAREEYYGLSDDELADLIDDDEVTPIEHEAKPDEEDQKQRQKAIESLMAQLQQASLAAQSGDAQAMQAAQAIQAQIAQINSMPPVVLHDVTVKRVKRSGQVKIEPVPPEEFFISRQAKRIQDAPFVAHVVARLLSDLRADGYEIGDDELNGDDSGVVDGSMEAFQRASFDDENGPVVIEDGMGDPSMRRVWVTEAYLRADVDGDGIAEWRRVLKCGSKILENVEADAPPFVLITPIPLPHRLIGQSVADLAMESQRQKTAMLRAVLDNIYLQANGRYFAVDGQVNLDDLLTSRPGGVVRIKNQGAVGPLVQGSGDLGGAQNLLEYMEVQKENRTGFTRYSQGADSHSLNKTATGISIVTNRADMRVELIARIFAETGVKDLFVQILKLVCQYQSQDAEIQLNGRWLNVSPREWRHQFDVIVNVGLGTNDPQQKIGQVQQLMQIQAGLAQSGTGVVSPVEMYNAATEFVKALGYKNADQFLHNPRNDPPQPPPPNPDVLKLQAQQQSDAAKLSLERERAENEAMLARERLQAEIALKREDMTMKYQILADDAMYQRLYKQSEAMVNDRGTAGSEGNGAGEAGEGIDGAPAIFGGQGSIPIPPGGGMGIQPGA